MTKERSEKQLAADKRLGDAAKLKAARFLVAAADAASQTDAPFVATPTDAAPVAQADSINRTTRSASTREKTTRRKPWEPPSMLDAPPPLPGFKHRWIRSEMMGEEDKINMGKRLREGYEPVRGDEYPDFELPTIEDGKHAGVISVGGLILARIPEETIAERAKYYSDLTNNQLQAIDNELKAHSQTVMPIGTPERSTRTEFGNPDK